MTRQEMIVKWFDDRTKAEAERYKDKQMDEPPAPKQSEAVTMFVARFQLQQIVRFKLDADSPLGHVTGIVIRQTGILYAVTWADTRAEADHYDFELEAVLDVDLPIHD